MSSPNSSRAPDVSFFLHNLIGFGRWLRRAGLAVDTGRLIDASTALQHVDLSAREDVHAALRALLVQRQDDIAEFDRAFDAYFDRSPGASDARDAPTPPSSQQGSAFDASGDASDLENVTGAVALRRWSDAEQLANKDFSTLTEDELAKARTAIAALTWNPGERRTRRWIPGRGERIDLRRALSGSLRTGGEIIRLPRKRRRDRPRPIVLLCDVSGSMEIYSRTLLHFAHSLTRRAHRVEAFLFATRLTRVTMQLRSPAPDAALAAVSRAVRDWSGGTRIGDALRTFHQRWRRRALPGGAVVILISDGWDRGNPALLRAEMARLQRSCHRLIWLNPLIGTVNYAPLTRGLEAALPFVDDFLPVRTLRDVRELALHLNAIDHHGHHRHLHLRRTTGTRLGSADGSRGNRVMHPRV